MIIITSVTVALLIALRKKITSIFNIDKIDYVILLVILMMLILLSTFIYYSLILFSSFIMMSL
jgi:hypothetical protein